VFPAILPLLSLTMPQIIKVLPSNAQIKCSIKTEKKKIQVPEIREHLKFSQLYSCNNFCPLSTLFLNTKPQNSSLLPPITQKSIISSEFSWMRGPK
jgi:hypothetical protein